MPKAPPRISKSVGPKTRSTGKRLWSNEGKSTTERGYGWQHQKARKRLLADDPLCRECHKHGRVTVGRIADHVVPLAEGGSREPDNLQLLCTACHAEKTASEALRGRKRH